MQKQIPSSRESMQREDEDERRRRRSYCRQGFWVAKMREETIKEEKLLLGISFRVFKLL